MTKISVDSHLLQEICEQIAAEIGAIVSIFAQHGEIVASSRRQRIGDFHEGGAMIMAGNADLYEITADEAAKSPSMLEGVTLPIDFDGERMFCVAVAAPLDVARQYGRIVRYWVVSHLKAAQAHAEYEKNLEFSEQRFRDVAESAGDWIWEMNADLRFTYVSPRFYEIFSFSPDAIIGKTRDEFAGRELDEPHWQKHYANLAARLSFRDFAYSTETADGSFRHVLICGRPVYDADGQFTGYRGTGRDVTELEHTRAEAERNKHLLELSEQRFRDVAESAGDWIWEMDADLRFTYSSPRFYEIFSFSPDAIIGKTRDEFAGRELDEPHWQKHYANLASHLPFRDFAYTTEAADGGLRDVLVCGRPVYGSDGQFTGYRGTGRDVSKQVEAEQALIQSEQRLSDAIETISEGFSLFDADDRLVIFNSKYQTLLYPAIDIEFAPGMTFESIIRRAAESGYIKDSEDRLDEWIEDRLARHRDPGQPHIHQRGDGRWIMVSERRTADGGTVAVYSDITELKQREEQLAEKSDAMEKLSNQLAKYLSPQVYASIFSGKQSPEVAPKRKKLTVFFSDIVDFTATTDSLEPEELTNLLNHYLTEMSKIADAYGATIDKYVGDGIIAFFGDPETRGVKEDATACVNMAIAMQRRMKELRSEWLDMGLERPFQVRIGINTGFCTVGNFGSTDRMDYTLNGNEVNLAARLESHSDVGGILLAYETYSLIKDTVMAEEGDTLTVKGFVKPVRTYSVVGLYDDLAEQGSIIHKEQDGVRILVDLKKGDKSAAIQAVEDVLSQLKD